MATTVTHVVDPDSGAGFDYDSLFDWEVGEQGDLTGVRDEIAVAKCRCTGGTADATAVTIYSWTTSATQYIKIWTDPAENYRHNGTYQTGNKYRLELAPVTNLLIWNTEYTRLDGLQIYATGTTYGNNCCTPGGASVTSVHISNCIFRVVSGNTKGPYGIDCTSALNPGAVFYIWNCVFQDFTGYTGVHAGISSGPTGSTWYVYNCTAYNCKNPYYVSAGTVYWKNCGAAASTGTAFTGGTQTTCSTDTPTFVSTTGTYDLHLQSGDTTWIGAATNLYNDAALAFQTDIDLQDRGGASASWDIGADEYVAAVSDISISISESLAFAEALD